MSKRSQNSEAKRHQYSVSSQEQGWKRIVFVVAFVSCLLTPAFAQGPTLVQVLDTLYNADGTKASGRLVFSWNAFTAAGGDTVDGGTKTYTIPATGTDAGKVNVSLIPNAGASPSGTSYRVRYYLSNGANYAETWVVPATGPVTIAGVRVLPPLPQPQATWLTMLNGLTATTQTFSKTDDANVTLGITSSGSDHNFTLGWTGNLPIARGGTNQNLWTASRCVRVNNSGTALESAASDCGTGGGSSGHTIQEEGNALAQRSGLNFIGGAITATDDAANNRTNVTVSINDSDIPSTITRDSEVNVQGATNQITSSGSGVAPTLALANPLTFPGKFTAAASGASAASANFPSGTAPSTPGSGDFWNQSGALKFYDGSATKSLAFTDSSITGNAATASALATDPNDCNTNQYATAIAANGNLACAQPLASQVTNAFDVTAANVLTNGTAPGTPATGKTSVWTDSTDKNLKAKDDAGVITVTVKPDAGTANNFLTAVSTAGVISKAQPGFSNLSGSATAGQVPNLENLNGTLTVTKGGTGAAPGADDQALISDSTSAATWRTLPNGAVKYTTSSNTFAQAGLADLTSSSSANLASVLSDETGGSGVAVFSSSPTIATPSFTTGFKIGGAATSGQIVRGNGTNFVAADDLRSVTYIAGADNASSVLADADDQPTFWRNNLGRTYRITEVWCESDGGTPSINLQRDDGTPANILSSNLSCSSTGATGSIAAAEQDIASGDKIDFVMGTAGGTAKRVTVNIQLAAQ